MDEDTPAWEAGLRTGDRLLSVAGAPPELPAQEQIDFVQRLSGALDLVYTREGKQAQAHIEPRWVEGKGAILGISPLPQRVVDLRESELVRQIGLQKDDRILSVNGLALVHGFDLLAGLRQATDTVRFEVERAGKPAELRGPELSAAQALALFQDVCLGPDTELHMYVQPRSAAADAGMKDGDRIVAVAGHPVGKFEDISPLVKAAASEHALDVVVRRRSAAAPEEQELKLSITPRAPQLSLYGFGIAQGTYVYQSATPALALRTGIQSSWRLMADSWLTLRRIATGQVSGENVGGIITIGKVSYIWAAQGLSKLFYFLCMLSVSLAFLNVLPIPVLDGGHLFFLLIEKLKGSPVSERVLSYSQIVGLVLLVSLVVYVTFNDIQRWIIR